MWLTVQKEQPIALTRQPNNKIHNMGNKSREVGDGLSIFVFQKGRFCFAEKCISYLNERSGLCYTETVPCFRSASPVEVVSFMRKFRKKPWRHFSRGSTCSHYIRLVCAAVFVLELAFFVRETAGGRLYRTDSFLETVSGEESDHGGETGSEAVSESIYGLRFRLEDGEIDFYKKEKLKSTN